MLALGLFFKGFYILKMHAEIVTDIIIYLQFVSE